MNISEASALSDLPAKTVRYYEDIGLVKPQRQTNGYRAYSADDIHKLKFLSRSRKLGFSIESCRQLLSLYEDKARASSEVKKLAKRHIEEIDLKIAELTDIRATLHHLVMECHGDERPDCPILDNIAFD